MSALAKQGAVAPLGYVVELRQLPAEGRDTYLRIHNGGPFDHGKDGTVFGNRERILPSAKRGYYREYTVKTPGSHDRGTRRIVCGGAPTAPDACFYTADHYASFRKIVP
jgi:ribonuclease T1